MLERHVGELVALADHGRLNVAEREVADHAVGKPDLDGVHQHFRRRPCHVYTHDMRVRVNATGLYTYPDVLAVCGEEEIHHA
jgi:hypothetical protein